MHHSESGSKSTAAGVVKTQGFTGCVSSKCLSQGIITLAGQILCLEHFLAKCYERLDSIEPVVRSPRLHPEEARTARALLQECANQTLLVCLRQHPLSNLERSRLLEILLQCGDLQVLLHRPAPQLT